MLPPLCNLFAALELDPNLRSELQRNLERTGAFASVQTVARDWIVAVAPLPGARTFQRELGQDFAFGEGGDLFLDVGHPTLEDLAATVDQDPQRLAKFAGDFGFIRLRRQHATIVRSCAGRVPFYYRRDAKRIHLASRLDYMVAFSPVDPSLDGLSTAVLLRHCCVFPEGRSPIRGVKCLAPAHYLTLTPEREAAPRRYWSPRSQLVPSASTERSQEEHATELREALLATLRRELAADAGNLLFFSGGLDSSALAALVCETLKIPISTQTFTSPDPLTAQYEASYISTLEERYRFSRVWRETQTSARCLELVRNAPKVSFPILNPCKCVLAELTQRAELRVALDGDFADESCGSPRRLGDWLDHTNLMQVLGRGGNNPLGRAAMLRWFIWRGKRHFHRQWIYLPDTPANGTRSDIQSEYADWVALERRRFADDTLPLRTLAFRVSRDQWLAEAWEGATSLGVRPLSAFYTRDALALYFACHPHELFDGKQPKALLRRAMQGYMPERHRLRPDKGSWVPYFEGDRGTVELRSIPRMFELFDERWLHEHFGRLGGLEPIFAEMGFLDSLHITSLGNMLSTIDRLADTKLLGPSRGAAAFE